MKQRYWIDLFYDGDYWHWFIRCINGRTKSVSRSKYKKQSLCINDAKSFADYAGLEVRL